MPMLPAPNAGLGRDINKGSVALVFVQHVFAVGAEKQIWATIIVHIAPIGSHSQTCKANPSSFGDVLKLTFAFVVIKRSGLLPFARTAIHQVHIKIAVAIVITEGCSRS